MVVDPTRCADRRLVPRSLAQADRVLDDVVNCIGTIENASTLSSRALSLDRPTWFGADDLGTGRAVGLDVVALASHVWPAWLARSN